MATYYHGAPEIQPDGLQTLYLMNPGYVGGYSDSPAPANMVFLNSTINSLNPITLSSPHHPNHHHQQQFVGIPLQPLGPAHDSDRPPPIQPATHDLSAIHGLSPRLGYNLWTPAASSNPVELPSPAAQLGPRRPAAAAAPAQQGLSLSLSPQQAPFVPYRAEPEMSPAGGCGEEAKVPAGVVGMQSVLMGSKYLKAAQQLLDEVVSVKGIKGEPAGKGTGPKSPAKSGRESEGGGEGDTSSMRGVELTTAERQELQMKKAKLVNMLDEVEQRYRQYHQQMQMVVSSFEAVAGFGSARTYTALALHTISKQFRCLRDAISGQIRATSRSLGEEDCLAGGPKSVGSRLRFVDHQLRQQRALQQLGMIQHNAWRPQRGLPERAVSVLRAWLFEHFLHPYPKDSDKHMLAKQTGLTRSQVSNWFINARVRLWKPMVEEMYTEETKDREQNKGDEKASKSEASEHSGSKSSSLQANSPTRTEQTDSRNDPKPPPITIPSAALAKFHAQGDESIMPQRLKKARSDESLPNPISLDMKPDELSNRELLMKFMDGRSGSSQHGYNLVAEAASHGGGFAAYPIGEIGRFNPEQFTANGFGGNGVSLTLGLPHCEPFSQPSYLSNDSIQLGRRIEMSTEASDYFGLNSSSSNNNSSNAAASHPPPNAYESINMQSRKRFAAQLLRDFVA